MEILVTFITGVVGRRGLLLLLMLTMMLPLTSSSSHFPCSLLSRFVLPTPPLLPPPIAPPLSLFPNLMLRDPPPLLVTLPSSLFFPPPCHFLPPLLPSLWPFLLSLLLSPQRVGPRGLIVASSASLPLQPHTGSRPSRDTRDLTASSPVVPSGESSLCGKTFIGYRSTARGRMATCGSSLSRYTDWKR